MERLDLLTSSSRGKQIDGLREGKVEGCPCLERWWQALNALEKEDVCGFSSQLSLRSCVEELASTSQGDALPGSRESEDGVPFLSPPPVLEKSAL